MTYMPYHGCGSARPSEYVVKSVHLFACVYCSLCSEILYLQVEGCGSFLLILNFVSAVTSYILHLHLLAMYYYMASNHLFSQSQHGFRSNHSTETALLTVSDHILSATDRQDITLLCLLDLSKCFDVIDHAKLLSKLQTYSIDPTWFSSYLHGHTQSVCTADGRGNRHLSRSLPNPIGVFQGSSLGPLLFQIFANDLALYAPQAHVVQYADDTQVLVSGKKDSLPQLIATMEQALSGAEN